jgi:hypothetical protein
VIVRSVEEIGWAVTSRGGPVETAGKNTSSCYTLQKMQKMKVFFRIEERCSKKELSSSPVSLVLKV